jgi:hypothetical protein
MYHSGADVVTWLGMWFIRISLSGGGERFYHCGEYEARPTDPGASASCRESQALVGAEVATEDVSGEYLPFGSVVTFDLDPVRPHR